MTWTVVFLAILTSSLGNIDNKVNLINEKKLREPSVQQPTKKQLSINRHFLVEDESEEYFELRKRRAVPTQSETDSGSKLNKCESNTAGSGDGLDLCAGYSCQENLTCSCDNNANSTAVICMCDDGFGGNEINCTDVDECDLIDSPCDINASCKNAVGTFTCSCNNGFSGNGFNCTDFDECKDSSVCPDQSLCKNSVGSFSCICNEGFLKNKDGQCVSGEEMFDVTMRLKLDYEPAYGDSTTEEFKTLANKIINATDKAYEMNKNYLKTRVISFVPGSVIANIQLIFQSAQPLPLTELKLEIENGTFGDLLVDKESIKVTVGDKCASKPCSTNATCTDLEDGQYQCTCKKGFLGNGTHCEGFVFVRVETAVKQVFTEELKNISSPEYRKTVRNFTAELTRLFQDEPGFVRVVILAIRNGSIIVDFEVVYRSKTPNTKTDKLQNVVDVLKKPSSKNFFRQNFLIKEPPPPPINITHDDVKENQILVKWDPPNLADQFFITSYLISFHPVDESAIDTKEIVSNEKNILLNNLKSDTFYNIYLRGKNKYGEGENSTNILVKTTRNEKDNQLVVIVSAAVASFVFVAVVVIGFVIAIRKRKRTRERNERIKRKRRRNERREIGHGFSLRSSSYPAHWRRSPVDLHHVSTDPAISHSYQNVHGNYDDVSEDFFDYNLGQ